jgi:4'-phosphopantetheinyl transferase
MNTSSASAFSTSINKLPSSVHLQVFEHPQDVTQEELQQDLLLLPEWRRQKVLSYHLLIDQVLCAKAYLLLKNGPREVYGITENPAFDYVRHEKPVLRDYPHIHFNLSHCKRGVMCVIDDEPIGCDIEEIEDTLDIDLCHFCYNDSEVADITSAEEPCVAFTKLWTMKEAVLKLTGEGINDDLPTLFDDGLMERLRFQTVIDRTNAFVYTTCQYIQNVKLIK